MIIFNNLFLIIILLITVSCSNFANKQKDKNMHTLNLQFDHENKVISLSGEINLKEDNTEFLWAIMSFTEVNKYFDVKVKTNIPYEIYNTDYVRVKESGVFSFTINLKPKLSFYAGTFFEHGVDSPYIDGDIASIAHGFIPIPENEAIKQELITLNFQTTPSFSISASLDSYKKIPWKDIYASLYVSHRSPAINTKIDKVTASFISYGFSKEETLEIAEGLKKTAKILEDRFGEPIIDKYLVFLMKVTQPKEYIEERKTFTGAGSYNNGIMIFNDLQKGSSWPNTFIEPSKNALRYLIAEACHFYFGSKPSSVIYPNPYWEGSFLHEGLNHYVSYLLEKEIGLIDENEFLKISNYFFNRVKEIQANSTYTLENYVNSQKNRERTFMGMQYSKGYVVSWWLDQKIRELSNSQKDIFSFSKFVLNKFRGKSYTHKEFLESVSKFVPNFPTKELFNYYETDKLPPIEI